MNSTLRAGIGVVAVTLSLGALVVDAQQRPQTAPAQAPEVFCNTMQAGALCPTGTVSVLKLQGPKIQQWLDIVGKYNDSVEGATKQLKADAKGVLTPAQMAELDRWMEKGINPEVNKILASRTPAGR
jgi:hypothetical protein